MAAFAFRGSFYQEPQRCHDCRLISGRVGDLVQRSLRKVCNLQDGWVVFFLAREDWGGGGGDSRRIIPRLRFFFLKWRSAAYFTSSQPQRSYQAEAQVIRSQIKFRFSVHGSRRLIVEDVWEKQMLKEPRRQKLASYKNFLQLAKHSRLYSDLL